MGMQPGFDAVAVVGRLASFPVHGAPLAALDWADHAADRVKRWAEALQAEVIHERELALMFPPLPPGPDDGAAGGGGAAGDDLPASGAAGSDRVPIIESPSGPASADEPSGPGADGSGERLDLDGLPSLGAAPPPLSMAERERLARRSWVLTVLTAFAGAFRDGLVSTAHVDVLAALLRDLDDAVLTRMIGREADLLAAARSSTVDVFRRKVRHAIDRSLDDEGESRLRAQHLRTFLSHWVREDRVHCGYFELDEVRGAALFAALEAEITALYAAGAGKGLTRKQVAAQALCNLQARGEVDLSTASPTTTGGRADAAEALDLAVLDPGDSSASGRPDGADEVVAAGSRAVRRRGAGVGGRRRSAGWRSKLVVLIDARTLRGSQHQNTVCETWAGQPFPPALARELLYEAQVTYGLTFDGRLVGLSSGQRLVTHQQRKALRIMYRTCAFPGCDVDLDECEIHHVVHVHEHGGTTVVETLVPLCRRRGGHHDLIHDGGWRARIDGERSLTWLTSTGQVHAVTPFTPLAELDLLTTGPADSGGQGSDPVARLRPGNGPPRRTASRRTAAAQARRPAASGPRTGGASAADPRRRRATTTPTLFDGDEPAA